MYDRGNINLNDSTISSQTIVVYIAQKYTLFIPEFPNIKSYAENISFILFGLEMSLQYFFNVYLELGLNESKF